MAVTLNGTPVSVGAFGGEFTTGDTLTEYDLPFSGDSFTPWYVINSGASNNIAVYFGPSIASNLPSQPITQPMGDAARFLKPSDKIPVESMARIPVGVKKIWVVNAVNGSNGTVLFAVGP